ncbi:retrovirus-related pol polyprotein from transposon TNT 1-94 [Tanacetum coccineum]
MSVGTKGSERDVVLSVVNYKGTPLVWIMDYACSFNMSPNHDWFVTYEEFDYGHVFMGNDSPCKVVGIGAIRIKMHDGVVRTLTDVRHVPDLKKNLISLGVLGLKGFKYTIENGVLCVLKGALLAMKATKGTYSLYTLQGETYTISASVSCSEKSNSYLTMLWHMRLGHVSERGMVILSKRGLLDNHKVASLDFCEHCVIRKQKAVPALGGARYVLSTIDDFSRMTKIKRLRTDNGLEFCSREFNDFCRDEGIARHYTVSAIDCKTPIDVWSGKPVDYSKLRVFGCPAYYHVSEGKLDPRGEKGIFMGSVTGLKAIEFGHHLKEGSFLTEINAKALSRFGFEDYVAYALQVAEEVESLELATYREAITFKESDMWSAAIEKLHREDYFSFWHEFGKIDKYSFLGQFSFIYYLCTLNKSKDKVYVPNTYACVVGSLMYVMVCTRLDIAYAMSVGSRYMAHPGKEHWNAVKRIFRYLKGTSDAGLIYDGEHEYLVAGYSDYVADLNARRSLTGYVFTIRNSVVSWKATLQPSVALSTTEAKYIALTEAAKEGIWLKDFIEDLGFPQDRATVFCDTMSAFLAKDQVYHNRTKHTDVRYHFIRTERRIKVKKISTEDNPTDVFTKLVPLSKFHHCLDLLNIDNWKYGMT